MCLCLCYKASSRHVGDDGDNHDNVAQDGDGGHSSPVHRSIDTQSWDSLLCSYVVRISMVLYETYTDGTVIIGEL